MQRVRHVAYIRVERGAFPFLTMQILEMLRRAFVELDRDPQVRVIVFTGAQSGAFMLHVEPEQIAAMVAPGRLMPQVLARPLLLVLRVVLAVLRSLPSLARSLLVQPVDAPSPERALLSQVLLFDAIERSRKITVAAIDGPCMGGGLELALCCDLRVASTHPDVMLGLPEARIGLMPGFGGTQRLTRCVGPAHALDVMLSAALIAPERALALGLVHRVFGHASFEEEVARWMQQLATRTPTSVAAIKAAVVSAAPRRRSGLFDELRLVSGLAKQDSLHAGLARYAQWLASELAAPDASFARAAGKIDAVDFLEGTDPP